MLSLSFFLLRSLSFYLWAFISIYKRSFITFCWFILSHFHKIRLNEIDHIYSLFCACTKSFLDIQTVVCLHSFSFSCKSSFIFSPQVPLYSLSLNATGFSLSDFLFLSLCPSYSLTHSALSKGPMSCSSGCKRNSNCFPPEKQQLSIAQSLFLPLLGLLSLLLKQFSAVRCGLIWGWTDKPGLDNLCHETWTWSLKLTIKVSPFLCQDGLSQWLIA